MRKRILRPRKNDLKEVVERRNKRLINFFSLCGYPVRLIADENSPAIVIEDKHVLNAYVHNFELRFTDSYNQGNIIYTIKLSENPNFDKNKVVSCIEDYPKRELSKILLSGSSPKLFLSGYNFLNKEEKLGKYPVFAAYIPKVYFTEEKAKEITDELTSLGYDVQTI